MGVVAAGYRFALEAADRMDAEGRASEATVARMKAKMIAYRALLHRFGGVAVVRHSRRLHDVLERPRELVGSDG